MNTEKAQFSVKINTELVAFLGKALPHRTSRIEAYTDLLNEQIKLLRIDFKGGSSVPFLVTVLDLVERWNWGRNTVIRFLQSLEKHGAIEAKRCQDGTQIRVLNISLDTP